MRWVYCFLFFIVASLHVHGELITTNNLSRLEEEVEKLDSHSLVLFDVDGTLIVPDDAILKPKGKALFKKLVAGHVDRDLFRDIRLKAPHSLVDSKNHYLIQKLQEKGIPTLAFTAAPAKIAGVATQPGDWRVDELQRYGFDFRQAFPSCTVLEIPKSNDQTHFPLFKSGVLYSSFHPKGDILLLFLQMMDLHPQKVIFVDDELEHVQSVVTSLEKQGIPCLGIYYTAAEEAEKAPYEVNLEQARFQINYFIEYDRWLSDSESKKLF